MRPKWQFWRVSIEKTTRSWRALDPSSKTVAQERSRMSAVIVRDTVTTTGTGTEERSGTERRTGETGVETETDTEMGRETETEIGTEVGTEIEKGTEIETEKEIGTEAETKTESDTRRETETAIVTDTDTEIGTEEIGTGTVIGTEKETLIVETETATGPNSVHENTLIKTVITRATVVSPQAHRFGFRFMELFLQ